MAAGDLIDGDYQYEFRGFKFGSGTDYQTELVEGILGLPTAVTNDDEKQEDHGMHPGQDLLSGRDIQISMNIFGDMGEDIEMKISKAAAVFQVTKRQTFVEFEFVTRRPGKERRFARARARRAAFPSNYDTARGLARGVVELFATDPRFWSAQEYAAAVPLAIGATTGQAVVLMGGDFEDGSDPIITITGPCTNPILQNATDGNRQFRTTGAGGVGSLVMGAADTLVVDFRTGDVKLNGVDAYQYVKADSQWWVLLPGNNTFVYSREAGNTGASSTATLRWRDAFTGA